jgi:heptose-I-phosphate ethanolaminephosphotransferase
MVMWFSPEFKQKHGDIVSAARKAVERPFMTDDLPHLLMGLAGIGSKYYSASRDLLSDSFNTKRPRLLKKTYDYDSLLNKSRFERERIRAGITFDSLFFLKK